MDVAKLLKTRTRGEIAVLARSTNALRSIALACADLGVSIDGHDKLFGAVGARAALQDHLRLALHPTRATPRLVRSVCRTPGRHLNRGAENGLAERLQAGWSFEDAFAGVEAPRRGKRDRVSLLAPGELFADLALIEDATEAVACLRMSGGLDQWFEEDDNLGGLDQFECEVLEQAQQDAAGLTPQQYLDDLDRQAAQLKASRDRERGVELATIHGAKGRQWPHVVLVACDEGTLPHARSQQVGYEAIQLGEGLEAERRLGYVAFTRASGTARHPL